MAQLPDQYGQQGYQQQYQPDYQQGYQHGPSQDYSQPAASQGYNPHAPSQDYNPYGMPQSTYDPPTSQYQHQHQQQQQEPDSGTFAGGSYAITQRHSNTVLNIELSPGGSVRSRPGAMIHMAGTVQVTGKVKFGWKKLLTGAEMAESTYRGHGRLALAPQLFGDILTLSVDGGSGGGSGRDQAWSVTRNAFLACTADVVRETKSQGLRKGFFSDEGLFVYRLAGHGLVWLMAFGAIERLDIQPGEEHIVDNGHLVAWNCNYEIESAGGGTFQSMKTGEGLVCRFVGPGTVYMQSRNQDDFESYIRDIAGSNR